VFFIFKSFLENTNFWYIFKTSRTLSELRTTVSAMRSAGFQGTSLSV